MRYTIYLILVVTQWNLASAGSSRDQDLILQYGNCVSNDSARSSTEQQGPNRWYFAYPKEYDNDYEVKMIDKSFDTRVADILYTNNEISFMARNFYKFEHADPSVRKEYDSYTNGPEVDQKLCKKHLIQMNVILDELEKINRYQRTALSFNQNNSFALNFKERHVLMARVLDSYGRYVSGLLIGLSDVIGSSEQCLETKLKLGPEPDDEEVVGMRYCKAGLEFNSDLDPRMQQQGKHQVYIEVGICLPNTCHSNSLKDNKHLIQRLLDSQFSMPGSLYVNKHREIENLFCTNDNNTTIELPFGGKLFVTAAIMWTLVIISATYYADDLKLVRSKTMNIIAKCFDVRVLARDFFAHDRDATNASKSRSGSRVNLDALNTIKVTSMMLIILGHTLQILFNYTPNLMQASTYFKKHHLATLSFSINQTVDSFFVISGLLFSYLSFKKFKTEIESSNTLAQISRLAGKLFFGRYLRLVPLYFIVFWFKKSVILYLGSGPLWDYGFNEKTAFGACKIQSWLTPLTPIASYSQLMQQCLPQTWSLGCEILFILLTTPALIILVRRPKLAMFLLSATGFISCMMMYNAVLKFDEEDLWSAKIFNYNLMHIGMVKFSLLYTNPIYRLFSVSSGLVFGYFIYLYEKDMQKWPIWVTNYATKLAIAALVLVFGSHYMIPTISKFELHNIALIKDIIIHMGLIYRVIWALATGIVSLRLVTDCQDTLIAKSFSGIFGRMMSKLNLAMLLIHVDVLWAKHIAVRNITERFSYLRAFDIFLVVYVYTVVLAMLVHVFIESPINKLIRFSLQGSKGSNVIKKKQL